MKINSANSVSMQSRFSLKLGRRFSTHTPKMREYPEAYFMPEEYRNPKNPIKHIFERLKDTLIEIIKASR